VAAHWYIHFLTPGSNQYDNVLWDWDSWLSNIALRQILQDIGTDKDKEEAIQYEQGCVLKFFTLRRLGWLPAHCNLGRFKNPGI